MSTTSPNPMNSSASADPLAQLRDIHLPEAVSNWPAPGWWLLTLLVCGVIFITWLAYRRYQRGAIKRAALSELEQIAVQYKNQPQQQLQQLSQLLRRVALVTQPRKSVAGLNNQNWLQFLDGYTNGQAFSQGDGQLLAQGPYQKQTVEFDAEAMIALSRQCIIGLFKGKTDV